MKLKKALDLSILRAGIKSNPKFKEAMEILVRRQRGRQDTTFSRIARILNEAGMDGWSNEMLNKFFTFLQNSHAGVIVMSEIKRVRMNGRLVVDENAEVVPSPRFLWAYNLQSVAAAALGMPEVDPEVREAPTPRRQLPKLAEIMTPVVNRSAAMKPKAQSNIATMEDGKTGRITFQRGGMEFEIDLDKVPQDAVKIVRFSLHR